MAYSIAHVKDGVEITIEGHGPKQVFKAANVEEALNKLAKAQDHASKKIAEQRQILRNLRPEPARNLVKFEPRPVSQEAQTAVNPAAVKEIVEAELGAPLEAVRETLNTAQQKLLRQEAEREAALFLSANPDFQPTPENDQKMVAYLAEHNMAYTAANLSLAYEALKAKGEFPEPQPQQQDSEQPEPAAQPVTVRSRVAQTGIPGGKVSANPVSRLPKLTATELRQMSSAEYRQRMADPQFRAAVEKLYENAPRS